LVATRNGTDGEVKLYLDGALEATGTGPTAPRSVAGLRIGGIQTGGGFFTGAMDDLRIYNTVLNAAEIASLGNPPPAVPPLIARGAVWKFNDSGANLGT